MKRQGRRRRWFMGPLVSLAALLAAAGGLEGALALLGDPGADVLAPFQSGGGTTLMQEFEVRFDETACLAPKPAGAYRILGLGDSFTYGWGVRAGETFLARLGQQLSERHPERAIDVLNSGMPGWNTVQEVDWLREKGLACHPDLVVIAFYLNDANAQRPWHSIFKRLERELEAENQGSWWYAHSRLYRLVKGRLDHRRIKRHILDCYLEDFFGPAEWARWQACQAALAEARALADEHGFELQLMIIPVLIDLGDDYPLAAIIELVRDACRRLSIPALDLLPHLSVERAEALWANPGDQHANARGHELMAAALTAEIERRGLLKRAATARPPEATAEPAAE